MRTDRRWGAWVLVLVSLAALGGCRNRRLVRTTVSGSDGASSGGVQVGGGDAVARGTPRQQLDQLDGLLRAQGYEPAAAATQASLQTNGIAAYAVDVQRGECHAIAVFGAQGSDVNLVVLDPAGRDVGHDVQPDGHPWVSFCTARAGRFVARVQQARGAGEYFFAPYVTRGRRPVDLRAFFGVEAQGPAVATLDAATGARLSALDQALAPQRFQRVGDPSGLELPAQAERVYQVSLEEGVCYVFATLGGPGVSDSDVALSDGSGRNLVADATSAPDAQVQYCAPESGNFSLRVRMFAGAGPLFTAAYVRPPEGTAVAAASQVLGGESAAGAGLEEAVALVNADMQARGYRTFGEAQQADANGGPVEFGTDLAADRCYALVALGDAGLRGVTVALRDARGREIDRDASGDARPTVRVCPSAAGRYTLTAQASAGTGHVVFVPFEWPRGTRLGDLAGVGYVRLAEVTALLGVESFLPDPGYSLETGRLRREGQSAQHALSLQGGQCYAVVVVGDEGLRDLDVALSSQGQRVATDLGGHSAFPSVRVCPPSPGTYQLEVRSAAGQGSYVYQVFAQQAAAGG